MIPYEDLVYALHEWRERKGLPTNAPRQPPSGARAATPVTAAPAWAAPTSVAPRGAAAPTPVRPAPSGPQRAAAVPSHSSPSYQEVDDSIAIVGDDYLAEHDGLDFGERPGTQPGFAAPDEPPFGQPAQPFGQPPGPGRRR